MTNAERLSFSVVGLQPMFSHAVANMVSKQLTTVYINLGKTTSKGLALLTSWIPF